MTPARFAAIILAGGLSTRMKQFKPLLPLGKATILDYVIITFQNAAVDTYVVTGYNYKDIQAAVSNHDVTFIYNKDYEKGMFTSVQAGVKALKPDYRAFFILPADIPLVALSTVKKMAKVSTKNPSRIIYPTYKGTRGHPPLIPAAFELEIAKKPQTGNLKDILSEHQNLAMEAPVDDEFILFDVDTPEDYHTLIRHYAGGNARIT